MEEKLVQVNGVEICTESFGDPSRPAVLLIMGAMASMVWWPEEFCRALASRGWFVIRYDHRDTGRSVSHPPGALQYTFEDLAEDAVGVLDAYGIERADFIGMSLGGILAQLVALSHPDRVATLTLISSQRLGPTDPTMPPMDPKIPAYHASAADLDWSDREAVIDYMVGGWRMMAGRAHPFDEETIRSQARRELERARDPFSASNHALLAEAEPRSYPLARISAPALVIHGTEDPVIPFPQAVALAEAIPGATLLPLEGVGHELHRDDWGTIIEAFERQAGAVRPLGS